jgi:prephenate dehydratase
VTLFNVIAYFGPEGTFTEEALLTEADLAEASLVAYPTIGQVLETVSSGHADLGFVPIENAIDGSVRDTLDALIGEFDLLIQREVVLDVHLHLMAAPGTTLSDVHQVTSFPVALAQCRKYLSDQLNGVEVVAANSTAEAARQVGQLKEKGLAAVAPKLAAELYGLEILAENVEDYSGNQTRFVAVARSGVPAPTGHDRTSIVCFQRSDRPGSLHGILGEFAARNINLTKLESRPTKRALGEYCFVIDLDGHIGDEVVADCLRSLHAELAGVKLLGSYAAAGAHAPAKRREVDDAWREADSWMSSLRSQIY